MSGRRRVFEFDGFVLDERARELRLRDRVVPTQPLVFDLLAFLIRHRSRVVSKDELLETLWPDVIVSDGSLKRAVSFARAALREGNGADAIRTYARQGYRFDAKVIERSPMSDDDDAAGAPRRASAESEPLARAAEAEAQQDWLVAAAELARADGIAPLGAADLERWANASQIGGRPRDAVAPLERAVAAYGAVGDPRGAARVALRLALIHFEATELHLAQGWHRRATSLLSTETRWPEHGLLAALSARFAIADRDYARALVHAREGIEIGRALGDVDIEAWAMTYLGMALVADGSVAEGVAVHNEAAAAVVSSDATPLIGGLVYCGIIWTCRNRGDWRRAAAWSDAFVRWCAKRSTTLYEGTCRLHHAEVLHHRGDLDAAEAALLSAIEMLEAGAPYAVGEAYRALGDVALARGELDTAEAHYTRAHALGWLPEPGLSRVHVARGRPEAAMRGLEHALADGGWVEMHRRAQLLANLVEASVAAGHLARAQSALDELDAHEELWTTPWLRASVLRARASSSEARGSLADAIAHQRGAIAAWHESGAPVAVLRGRLRLTRLLAANADHEAALLELAAVSVQLETLHDPVLSTEYAAVRALLHGDVAKDAGDERATPRGARS